MKGIWLGQNLNNPSFSPHFLKKKCSLMMPFGSLAYNKLCFKGKFLLPVNYQTAARMPLLAKVLTPLYYFFLTDFSSFTVSRQNIPDSFHSDLYILCIKESFRFIVCFCWCRLTFWKNLLFNKEFLWAWRFDKNLYSQFCKKALCLWWFSGWQHFVPLN